MTTLKVEYYKKYSPDLETVYYKLKGEYPRFENPGGGSIIVATNQGQQLLLWTGRIRSAVFLKDDDAVAATENVSTGTATTINIYTPEGLDPRDAAGVVRQSETLW